MAATTGGSGGLRGAIEAQVELMSPRDRKLLAGLVLFVGFLLTVGFVLFTRGLVNDKAERVRSAKNDLEILQAMADNYQEAALKVSRAETRLTQFKGQPASAYLEKVARDNSVIEQLTVNQQGTELVGTMRQTTFRAELKKVSVQSAIEFLYDFETSGYPAKVTLARFKPSGTPGEKIIDVSLELVSYQVEEG